MSDAPKRPQSPWDHIPHEYEYGLEDRAYETALEQAHGKPHPERYILGKPHPDRARQFKPFAALRGYEELVAEQMEIINSRKDFSELEEGC